MSKRRAFSFAVALFSFIAVIVSIQRGNVWLILLNGFLSASNLFMGLVHD